MLLLLEEWGEGDGEGSFRPCCHMGLWLVTTTEARTGAGAVYTPASPGTPAACALHF